MFVLSADGDPSSDGAQYRRASGTSASAAFVSGALQKTPILVAMLADLSVALEQDDGQKLGGKSAEAARFILRAISRELDNA